MGIEPTPSRFRCDALPAELPNLLEQGGREWSIQLLAKFLVPIASPPACLVAQLVEYHTGKVKVLVRFLPKSQDSFKKSWDLYASATGLNL